MEGLAPRRDQAAVGDGDAMGITREIAQDFRGSPEWTFAGMFGSAFLGAHLMPGAAAAALLAWAIVHQTAHPWLSLGAGVAALVALRGCPMCWTVGLVETLSQGRRDSTAERADRTWLH